MKNPNILIWLIFFIALLLGVIVTTIWNPLSTVPFLKLFGGIAVILFFVCAFLIEEKE